MTRASWKGWKALGMDDQAAMRIAPGDGCRIVVMGLEGGRPQCEPSVSTHSLCDLDAQFMVLGLEFFACQVGLIRVYPA